jgi:hypothetical protein
LHRTMPFLREATNSCSDGQGDDPKGPAMVWSQDAAWCRLHACGKQEVSSGHFCLFCRDGLGALHGLKKLVINRVQTGINQINNKHNKKS